MKQSFKPKKPIQMYSLNIAKDDEELNKNLQIQSQIHFTQLKLRELNYENNYM